MNVLVLAYYFPPLGLSGVQRITKFVKYLPEYGWYPTVVTPRPAAYFAHDDSLLADVDSEDITIVRTASFDPTRLARVRSKSSSTVPFPNEKNRKRLSSATQLLLLPDNKIGWYPSVLKAARKVIEEQSISAIISTAPPYTAHLAGARLAKKFNIPLILDFRDDWLDNPRHRYPTTLHKRIHKHMESRVMQTASACVTINSFIADALETRNPEFVGRVHIIPQGYDADDLIAAKPSSLEPASKNTCTFLYTGVFYDAQQPDTFLRGVAEWLSNHPQDRQEIRLEFAGLFPDTGHELAKRLGIEDLISMHGYLPHNRVCERMTSADVLWMTIGNARGAEQISTGKLYEYLGARKPILALIPAGAARNDLEHYSAATIVDPDDVTNTARAIGSLLDQWREKRLPVGSVAEVQKYDRRLLTGILAQVLEQSR